MSYRLIDTHCHIHFNAYKEDMEEVVARAREAGVGMITVGTQSGTSRDAVVFAEAHDGVWATIGLHPGHLHKPYHDESEVEGEPHAEHFDEAFYAELAKHPKVVAVGEFGLDYYRVPEGIDLEQMKADQKAAVRQQLRFASDVDKPVVIHCRDAHADQAELIREEIERGGLRRRGVIHCFTGTAAEAAMYRELGFMVSITGIVTFGKNIMDMVKEVPLDQMMIETDSPYLTPAPHRGKRNEPANVEHVARKIAELKGIDFDEVARVTTENAKKLFSL